MTGSFEDMGMLLSNIGIKGSARGKFNDPFMLLITGHPSISLESLEDYLMDTYPEYADMSLSDFFDKHDPQNVQFWKFYLNVEPEVPNGHPISK